MDREIDILIVEDSPDDAHLLVHELTQAGLKIRHERVDTEPQMRAALVRQTWDVILCDYSIPNFGALPALKIAKEMKIKVPFIVISGVMGEETAISVMKAGAHDFITKGNYTRLVPAINREIEEYLVRKKAIEEAKKQKQLAFTMIMQNPMPLIIFSTNLDIKLANESFLTLCGWSEERLQKMSMKEFKVLEKSGHGIKEAINTKKGVTGDVVVEFPTGVKYLEQHTIPLLDKDGEIVSMMATYQDNTEKRKQELAKSELADFTDVYLATLSSNLGMLATGNLAFDLKLAPPTENTREAHTNFSGINNNLTDVQSALTNMIADANMLAKAAVEGKLDTRADATRHLGDYRKIVEGVNATLDAVIGPLNMTAEYIDRISKGEIPAKITEKYNGDFNEIKNNLNQLIDVANNLLKEADVLVTASKEGKLDTRGNADQFAGGWKELYKGINNILDAILLPIGEGNRVLAQVSNGKIDELITQTYKGDHEAMKQNINNIAIVLQKFKAEIDGLTVATIEGKLDTRGKPDQYKGAYGEVIKGINNLIDAFVTPINVTAEYVDRISKGEIPAKITDKYNGDFNEIKNTLNACIDNINALVADANLLAKATVEGKLKVRADATKHMGDYRKIVEGMNATLGAVAEPVNEVMRMANEFAKCNLAARVDENLHMEGDFVKLKEALNNTGIEVSKAMIMINQQITELASSAEEANASIEEVSSGAEQIAKNAAGVSTNAEHGNEGIGQVLRAMEDLSVAVTEVAQKSEKVSQLTEGANTLSLKGTDLAEQAERGMQSITTSSNEVDKIIVDIKAEMDKIGKIVGLISDLANQTNLLALNAAIEAARAGEAGRGFAVVATEVKSLAQESRASAENIADMIGTLQKKSVAAGEAVASSNREVKAGSEALSQTLRSFKDIAKSIEDISKNIVEVASASEEQAATVEEVTASVNEVQGMVQATAKDAMDSAAAAEEASASIDQITKVMGGVNEIVNNVSKEIAKFKV